MVKENSVPFENSTAKFPIRNAEVFDEVNSINSNLGDECLWCSNLQYTYMPFLIARRFTFHPLTLKLLEDIYFGRDFDPIPGVVTRRSRLLNNAFNDHNSFKFADYYNYSNHLSEVPVEAYTYG